MRLSTLVPTETRAAARPTRAHGRRAPAASHAEGRHGVRVSTFQPPHASERKTTAERQRRWVLSLTADDCSTLIGDGGGVPSKISDDDDRRACSTAGSATLSSLEASSLAKVGSAGSGGDPVGCTLKPTVAVVCSGGGGAP